MTRNIICVVTIAMVCLGVTVLQAKPPVKKESNASKIERLLVQFPREKKEKKKKQQPIVDTSEYGDFSKEMRSLPLQTTELLKIYDEVNKKYTTLLQKKLKEKKFAQEFADYQRNKLRVFMEQLTADYLNYVKGNKNPELYKAVKEYRAFVIQHFSKKNLTKKDDLNFKKKQDSFEKKHKISFWDMTTNLYSNSIKFRIAYFRNQIKHYDYTDDFHSRHFPKIGKTLTKFMRLTLRFNQLMLITSYRMKHTKRYLHITGKTVDENWKPVSGVKLLLRRDFHVPSPIQYTPDKLVLATDVNGHFDFIIKELKYRSPPLFYVSTDMIPKKKGFECTGWRPWGGSDFNDLIDLGTTEQEREYMLLQATKGDMSDIILKRHDYVIVVKKKKKKK